MDYRTLPVLEESFRWFGPADPVSLPYIRQTGASAVFTSLHDIPYGEMWPREAIQARLAMIEAAGLRWTAVESVPVHEDIKTGSDNLTKLFENYTTTLRHLAAEGITTVVYNFMPVLDWVRTDMRWVLPDGSESLHYDPARFAAFEIHALKRAGAEATYSPEQLEQASAWWASLDDAARDAFVRTIIDVFPGVKWALTLDDIRAMLAKYDGMGADGLRENLGRFLEAVIPVAEEVGVRMAIHPDDPPFSVLGLPRIVSTAGDVETIFNMADSFKQGTEAKGGQDFANFFSNVLKESLNKLWLSGEFLSQLWVLCRNTHWTGIQMADAHHDATRNHKWRCCKSILFSTEQRRNYNIAACL